MQRLGGHLDEAKTQLLSVQAELHYKLMDEAVRAELELVSQNHVNKLQVAYENVVNANALTRLFTLYCAR